MGIKEGAGRCRSCGAEIFWIKNTQTGKLIPCDPRVRTVITETGNCIKGRETHFATCPQAEEWRKKNA